MEKVRKIDIHVHAIPEPDLLRVNGTTYPLPDQLRRMYDQLNIERGILLPPGSAPEGTGDRMSQREARQLVDNNPDVFCAWFCNLDPRQGSNDAKTDFSRYLAYYKSRGAVAVGEMTANVWLSDPRMRNLLEHCAKNKMPVLFHLGKYGGDYGVVDSDDLHGLELVLDQIPNLKVIGHSPRFWKNTEKVRQLMERHPNLYCEFSSISGGKAILEDPAFTYRFFEDFSDRIFYATDLHSPDNLETYDIYEKVAAFLDDAAEDGKITYGAYERICRGNALRLIEGTL